MAVKSKKSSKSTISNGLILRGFRKQNKLTQADIASVVGKNKRTISSYEIGKINIPSSVISILNKKYKLGLTSTSKTTDSKSVKEVIDSVKTKSTKGTKTTKYNWDVKSGKISKVRRSIVGKGLNVKVSKNSFSGRFQSFIKSTGLTVAEFSSKYHMSTAQIYRILNNNGTHYFSTTTIKKIAKDTDIVKLFK